MFPERTKSPSLQEQGEYWKRKIHGLQPLQLMTDFPRPPVPSYRRDSAIETLDHHSLVTFCSQNNLTAEITLLTILKILLLRYANQERICVGYFANEAESDVSL